MKEKNNKVSKGSKGKETKTKPVKEKIYEGAADLKKLMEGTMKKLASLAGDIEVVPRKRYTGYKLDGRLLSSIMPKKMSFDMSIH